MEGTDANLFEALRQAQGTFFARRKLKGRRSPSTSSGASASSGGVPARSSSRRKGAAYVCPKCAQIGRDV